MIKAESARKIAFYLPQFHEIEENNLWWGKGFTEWTNVKKARPLFSGHSQPIEPGALGYYDLTNDEIRIAQANLASQFKIEGFCYWNYWFGGGRKILEMPLDRLLKNSAPDFPFCICWANQTWTGIWHGSPQSILIEQTYPGQADIAAHFAYLKPYFEDARYVRFDGKPVFCVYRPNEIPNAQAYLAELRRLAEAAGLRGLHIIAMSNKLTEPNLTFFDQVMSYGPGDYIERSTKRRNKRPIYIRIMRKLLANKLLSTLTPNDLKRTIGLPSVYHFKDVVDTAFSDLPKDDFYVPCVLTGWDNTPRSARRGIVFEGYTPQLLFEYTRKAVKFNESAGNNSFIFFKAWNEWAEGNMLEPTKQYGDAYLQAVKAALE